MKSLALLLPGPIDQFTGGYLYARRLVDCLRAQGIAVAVNELAGGFPDADAEARAASAAALATLPDGAVAVIDGLALAGFAACLDSAARRLRLLALVHHPLAEETGIGDKAASAFAALEALMLPRMAGVICPSARTAAAVAAYGVSPQRIAVAPPGTMKPTRPVTRIAHAGPLHLLSVATVTPRKGHDVLLEALARIDRGSWRLQIIGSLARDGATVAALRARIAKHNLAAQVELAGERQQGCLAEAYESADIFVLASHHEGYGMAFAEALAYGLPIVATTGGAIPETVPASAGLLVPPGDTAALADALARLIGDADLRARLAEGAAAAGATLPDWSAAATGWLAAAERLLA